MHILLLASIITMLCAVPAFADNLNKVKLINATTLKLDLEYCSTKDYILEVVKVNNIYNRLHADYEIIKDFPLDTTFEAQVFRSNSGCNNYEKIGDYPLTLCGTESSKQKYFQYLPNEFINLNKQNKCVPKGMYRIPDHGYFKFYNLLSEEKLKDACFKLIGTFTGAGKVLYSEDLDFVSN